MSISVENRMMDIREVDEHIRSGSRKQEAVSSRLMEVCQVYLDTVWDSLLPSHIQLLLELGGGSASTRTEPRDHAIKRLHNNVSYGLRYVNQPAELVWRLLSARYYYAQCLKENHYVSVSPFMGVQGVTLFNEHVSNEAGHLMDMFNEARQVGVCDYHNQGTCSACNKDFLLLEQEQRFWHTTSGECGSCLAAQLIYKTPKHNAKELKTIKEGKKTLHKFTKWAVTQVAPPVGPAFPSPFTHVTLSADGQSFGPNPFAGHPVYYADEGIPPTEPPLAYEEEPF